MKEIKKVIFQNTNQIVDHQTGEVTQTQSTQVRILEKEPEYIKLYLCDIMRLEGLPIASNSLLFELLKRMSYSNEIVLVKSIREEICSTIKIADITFRKSVDKFVEKSILLKKNKGVYIANPAIFGKGSWDNVKKIRLLVEYNENGRFLLKEEIESSEKGSEIESKFEKENNFNQFFMEQAGES